MALGLCDYSMAGTDGRNCSSVNENTPGALKSFVIGPDGLLSDAVDTVASGGDAPAFTVPLSTGQVAIMNVTPFPHPYYFTLL